MFKKSFLVALALIFSLTPFFSLAVGAEMTTQQLLTITKAEARNVRDTSATIYWEASTGSQGEYRYARNVNASNDLTDKPWISSGVVNGSASGHLYGSQAEIGNLITNTTYYVEIRKSVGDGMGGKIYGPTTFFFVTTLGDQVYQLFSIAKVEARNVTDHSASFYWQASTTGLMGEFRYATSQAALVNQPWTSGPVLNGLDSGHIYGSIASLSALNANTTYYVEVRKFLGGVTTTEYGQTSIMWIGSSSILTFTTLAFLEPVYCTLIAPVCPDGSSPPRIGPNCEFADCPAVTTTIDNNLISRIAGRILLQVESNGEAWYLDPIGRMRFYLRDGNAAYIALRAFGLGITDGNLSRIPIGLSNYTGLTDTDGDGLPDKLEEAIKTNVNSADTDGDGYNDKTEVLNDRFPAFAGPGSVNIDQAMINRLRGRIVLQVESRGEAWYINPTDGKRYFLGDGNLAYVVMRYLSLGITNEDLRKIPIATEDPGW